MGRHRKITADAILDAAERVVLRQGAAGLSIDAVAKEAGTSKATVVYDHKSKSALLAALVERRMREDTAEVALAVQAARDTAHPELFGRIAAAGKVLTDADRAVAIAVSAAMSGEAEVQNTMRAWASQDLQAMAKGTRPKAALMTYLALAGFVYTELFGFHDWSGDERQQILDDIAAIYAAFPESQS